jgi:hypothetical protein
MQTSVISFEDEQSQQLRKLTPDQEDPLVYRHCDHAGMLQGFQIILKNAEVTYVQLCLRICGAITRRNVCIFVP